VRGRFDLDVPARRAPEQAQNGGEHEESDDDKDHERDHAKSLLLNGLKIKLPTTGWRRRLKPLSLAIYNVGAVDALGDAIGVFANEANSVKTLFTQRRGPR
jgi:hypothetical protein